jgi:hypothetical protein
MVLVVMVVIVALHLPQVLGRLELLVVTALVTLVGVGAVDLLADATLLVTEQLSKKAVMADQVTYFYTIKICGLY